jgi:hypothetical protein
MNILHLYAAYDRKAQYYLPLFQTRSEGEAVRSFTEAVLNPETPLSRYPAEFDLCLLGDMDVETGEIFPKQPVGLIINGLVAMEAAHKERARYAKALNPQVDIEELIAEQS